MSFRIDWFDLLAIQGTLKSILQYHSSKASILWCSAFFTVQLSCPYMTTGKTIALTRGTFVGKVMSLPFNMLSRLVTAFLPRRKHLLISWLQSQSAVILESKKIKSVTVSIVSPFIFHEVMGPGAMILVFWMLSYRHMHKSHSLEGQLTSLLNQETILPPFTHWFHYFLSINMFVLCPMNWLWHLYHSFFFFLLLFDHNLF